VRIIAGTFKGHRLIAPQGDVARPTTDRVKESLFHLLGLNWTGCIAVDLFSGSGALGLEALSRGAESAILVDSHPQSIRAIKENVKSCRAEKDTLVWKLDWLVAWRSIEQQYTRVGWVFVDPPYAQRLWSSVLLVLGASAIQFDDGVVCEHPNDVELPIRVGCLKLIKTRQYGDICISIYNADTPQSDNLEERS